MPSGSASAELAASRAQLQSLLARDRAASITAELLTPAPREFPVVVAAAAAAAAAGPAAAPAPQQTQQVAVAAPPATSAVAAATSSSHHTFVETPLTETAEQEIRRLELTVNNLTEVNDRVMTQNIALLHDLEACQKAVRDLRAEKDALAVQLKRALEREAAAGRA